MMAAAAEAAHRYPKAIRLRTRDEIDRVFRQGVYHRMGWLQAKALPNGRETSRFMVSVRKSVGTAPERNRIKRVLREALRLHRDRLLLPHDICFFVTVRPRQAVCLATVAPELKRLFGRLARNQ